MARFGCSTIVFVVTFVISFSFFLIEKLFSNGNGKLIDGFGISIFLSATAAFIIFILTLKDRVQNNHLLKKIRKSLKQLEPQSQEDFLAPFSQEDRALAIKIRKSLADFFEIAPESIHLSQSIKLFHSSMFECAISELVLVCSLEGMAVPENTMVAGVDYNQVDNIKDLITQGIHIRKSWKEKLQQDEDNV